MTTKNQSGTKNVQNADLSVENLQETENRATFAQRRESFSKLLYYDPMSDFGFKKLFGKEKVMRAFLNDLLEPASPITKVIFKDKEKMPATEEERRSIFDLRCETADGKDFIVEMQRAKHKYFSDRILYYLSRGVELAEPGNKRSYEIKPIYGIFLLDFRLSELLPRTIRRIRFMVDGTNEVFNDKIQAYTIEFPSFYEMKESDCQTNMDIWIYNLLNMGTMTEPLGFRERMPIFDEIANMADLSKLSKEEYEAYFWECENRHSNRLIIEEGLERAREEGAIEERNKIAISMKKNGASTDFIVKCLNMSIEEVEALPTE